MERLVRAGLVLAGLLLATAAFVVPYREGSAQPARQSFDIVTGSADGGYFPVGEQIARVISHPPGLARCEKNGVCAPSGIVVSARSSDGAVDNVLAVNEGSASSGLAQASIVADAVAGRGPFRKAGRQSHIRVMADLFAEPVQLVVAAKSNIVSFAGLRGRRVSLGMAGTGDDAITAGILQALGVHDARLRRDGTDAGAVALRDGRIDAMFVLDAAPTPAVADLLARGTGRLVPISGKARDRVVSRVPGLSADTIPAGAYRGTGAIETVSVHVLWIAGDTTPPDVVYGLVQALYNPANRGLLAGDSRPAQQIRPGESASLMSLPLHPGAARYYREAGLLPPPRQVR